MTPEPRVDEIADALQVSFSLLIRRLKQVPVQGDLTLPEMAALSRLDRLGPMTSAELAKIEQISPQSMGATLAALEARQLIHRSSDPTDGRRVVMSLSPAGTNTMHKKRTARGKQLARALDAGFTAPEREQLMTAAALIERLALELK